MTAFILITLSNVECGDMTMVRIFSILLFKKTYSNFLFYIITGGLKFPIKNKPGVFIKFHDKGSHVSPFFLNSKQAALDYLSKSCHKRCEACMF